MLIRLFGKNFRSLKNDFELSMVAADLERPEDRDRGVIGAEIHGLPEPLSLLRCVAVYGANASGKSTVLIAARALNWLVTWSSQSANPGDPIPPYEPFLLNRSSQKADIRLGCEVAHQGTVVRYEITYDQTSIKTETLTKVDGKGIVDLIKRAPKGEVQGRLIEKSPANKLYVQDMQPNVTVLSKLAQHGPARGSESAVPYQAAIRSATQFRDYSASSEPQSTMSSRERFATDPQFQKWIMRNLIQVSDLGICDVETREQPIEFPGGLKESVAKLAPALKLPASATVVSFVHQGDLRRTIDFTNESAGPRKLFHLAADWWALSHESPTILADEISASLHPRLLDRLVRAINEAPSTTSQSQLIFTTHDTGLMESHDGLPPALRRDQIYLAEKDDKGVSQIYPLIEFKEDARPVHNLRKRYLSGRYGAIPNVEDLSL